MNTKNQPNGQKNSFFPLYPIKMILQFLEYLYGV
jgi:hypothetical protein